MTEVGVSLALRRHRNLIGTKEGTISKKGDEQRRQQEQSLPSQQRRRRRRRHSRPRSPSCTTLGLDSTSSSDTSHLDIKTSCFNYAKRSHVRTRTTTARDQTDTKTTSSSLSTSPPTSAAYSSIQIFLEMAALYAFCMVLPSIVGVLVRAYKASWQDDGILYRITVQTCSLSWMYNFYWCKNYRPTSWTFSTGSSAGVLAPDAGISDVAIVVLLSLTMACVRITLVHYLVPNYKQPQRLEALVRCKSIHLLSSSYPGSVTPTRVVKMKSLDETMLVSKLQMPNLMDKNSNIDTDVPDVDSISNMTPMVNPLRLLAVPDSDTSAVKPHKLVFSPNGRIAGPSPNGHSNFDPSINNNSGTLNVTATLPSSFRGQALQHDNGDSWQFQHDDSAGWHLEGDDFDDDDDDDNQFPAPAVSSGLLTNTSAQNLQALLEQAAPPSVSRDTLRPTSCAVGNNNAHNSLNGMSEDGRIFAAPKYATAVFRLMYCLVSCLTGYMYFANADFWPPVVGGKGSTKNCWDLSSVGATVMDSDFDQRNTVLRRYYLFQASYHFHSGAFHVLTSLLLWFVSKSSRHKDKSTPAKFLGFIPAGMFTLYNVRTFFQHFFSIVLIGGTYLFSSTRRLGAIAMFSFDASSLFLHLLQLGINAPPGSKRNSPTSIRFLHRVFVIPTFCYARFYIFPFVVGYSALEESQDWLRQLENMLVPGTAKFIHGFFVVAFLLFMGMNLVYFGRLLNHTHVMDSLAKRSIRTDDEEEKAGTDYYGNNVE